MERGPTPQEDLPSPPKASPSRLKKSLEEGRWTIQVRSPTGEWTSRPLTHLIHHQMGFLLADMA